MHVNTIAQFNLTYVKCFHLIRENPRNKCLQILSDINQFNLTIYLSELRGQSSQSTAFLKTALVHAHRKT